MTWTHFWDMYSGGRAKEKWEHIFIEAPTAEARVIFYNRFGHNPDRVTCTCCGGDYSVSEAPSLEEGTAYHRGCLYAYFDASGAEVPRQKAWVSGKGLLPGCSSRYVERADPEREEFSPYIPLEVAIDTGRFGERSGLLVIRADEIKPEERSGEAPEQGYVWKD